MLRIDFTIPTLLLVFLAISPGPVFAKGNGAEASPSNSQSVDQPSKPLKISNSSKMHYLGLNIHTRLQAVQHALGKEGDAVKALQLMQALEKQYDGFRPYERAVFWHVYATIYNSRRDYANVELAYTRMLQQEDLPEALALEALYRLAQIHFVQEEYPQAIDRLNDWFEYIDKPGPAAYLLLGQSYYQVKEYPQAASAMESAIAIARQRGEQVKENWYLLLRAIYHQQQDHDKTLGVLISLIAEYPKKEYYAHIAAIYAQLGREFEHYSMLVGMADAQLLDRGEEQLNYAQLLIRNDRPYRAARLLEQGLAQGIINKEYKNLKLLATSWMLAKETEKSIPALEQAAQLSDTGDDYVLLAHAHINAGAWDKAERAVTKALDRGNLERPDAARLLLGMSLFNLQKYDQALVQFAAARQDDRSREIASQWQQYVRAERSRNTTLENL